MVRYGLKIKWVDYKVFQTEIKDDLLGTKITASDWLGLLGGSSFNGTLESNKCLIINTYQTLTYQTLTFYYHWNVKCWLSSKRNATGSQNDVTKSQCKVHYAYEQTYSMGTDLEKLAWGSGFQ